MKSEMKMPRDRDREVKFLENSREILENQEIQSSQTGDLRRHLKAHRGEKSNKGNRCDFASSQASDLRTHLKTHSGEKSNKCNQCDYASSQTGTLKRHLKTHSG